MAKSPDAFRTISEVADWLGVQAHVLRFWESKFTQVKPIKRAGGRRYYRPADMLLLGGIKKLLHDDGLTIKGVQKILREQGMSHVADQSQALDDLTMAVIEGSTASEAPKAAAEPEPETVAVDDTPEDTGEMLQAEASSVEAEEDVDDASAPAPEIEALLSDDAEADEAEVAPEAEPAPVSEPDPAPEARPEPDGTPEPAPPAAAETPPEPDPLPEEARETPEPETEEETAPIAPVPEPESISDPEPEPVEASPEAAEVVEPEPAPEDPAPEEETGDAEEVDAAALPSFIRRPLAEPDAPAQAEATPETPPEDAAPAVQPEPETAEPEVAAGDDATAEQPAPEPAAEDAAPAEPAQLKPRVIDLPDLPVEADLPAAPSALSAVARAKSLAAKDRDAAKPLLAQLIRLRASMANPRKDTHKD
ncbi:MerR family transcriptional regulator [uncultured Roseobacter sp.]|uniref:MerR family transcriptional regulator n=1 Tax=uncultured Roseobacter sp. TaxID=114847 RepID=UPI0026211828|nr:MerR family transcriptional regulator [uncultured Roseobacter sp.]